MLRLLLQHLRYFRRLITRALDERKRYAAKITAFEKAAEVFKRQAVEAGPGLDADLLAYEQRLRHEKWVREQQQEEFWPLQLLPYDRSKWIHPIWTHGKDSWVQDLSAPPPIIERAETIFSKTDYPADYKSIENLHTWLQIRAAVIFKLFLSQPRPSGEPVPELTLSTTARLIVLFYQCAGLGKPYSKGSDSKFFLKVEYTTRSQTVSGISEKLIRHNVDKVLFGSMAIPDTLTKARHEPSTVEALYCRDFDDFVEKVENGEPVVPLTFIHALNPRFVEPFSDHTVSIGFSAEDDILNKELISEGYTLLGFCVDIGVLLMRFETSQQSNAAEQAARHALKDSARGRVPGTS